MSRRFRFCLAVWIAVVAVSVASRHVSAQETGLTPVPEEAPAPPQPQPLDAKPVEAVDADEWVISIHPGRPARTPAAAHDAANGKRAATYSEIYNSIPFDRARYNANPTYRHDAAMEILTGNARNLTVVRHDTLRTAPAAARPVIRTRPAGINPYHYGYLRPSLRLQYYRHFPSLNPYVNIWNYSGAF